MRLLAFLIVIFCTDVMAVSELPVLPYFGIVPERNTNLTNKKSDNYNLSIDDEINFNVFHDLQEQDVKNKKSSSSNNEGLDYKDRIVLDRVNKIEVERPQYVKSLYDKDNPPVISTNKAEQPSMPVVVNNNPSRSKRREAHIVDRVISREISVYRRDQFSIQLNQQRSVSGLSSSNNAFPDKESGNTVSDKSEKGNKVPDVVNLLN